MSRWLPRENPNFSIDPTTVEAMDVDTSSMSNLKNIKLYYDGEERTITLSGQKPTGFTYEFWTRQTDGQKYLRFRGNMLNGNLTCETILTLAETEKYAAATAVITWQKAPAVEDI